MEARLVGIEDSIATGQTANNVRLDGLEEKFSSLDEKVSSKFSSIDENMKLLLSRLPPLEPTKDKEDKGKLVSGVAKATITPAQITPTRGESSQRKDPYPLDYAEEEEEAYVEEQRHQRGIPFHMRGARPEGNIGLHGDVRQRPLIDQRSERDFDIPRREQRLHFRPPEGRGYEPSPVRRLEMPICTGAAVSNWIYQAERYFHFNKFDDYEMVSAAAICMEGKALNWYRWCQKMYPIVTWLDFKEGLLERFQGVQDEHERLFALMQTGSVGEYRDKFEEISAGLEGIPEGALLGAFMKGLREPIKAAVRPFQPTTLYDAMARLVEENQEASKVLRIRIIET